MLDHNSLDDNKRKKELESIQNDDSTGGGILYFVLGLIQGLILLLLAFVLPPLAVALKGTFKQFITNLLLTLFLWIPGVIHALMTIEISFKKK